jgi:hypothetical protein
LPIAWKEVQVLKTRLNELDLEFQRRFAVAIRLADYHPRPSDLFEYFVLYNCVLAVDPIEVTILLASRGDARGAGFIPFGMTRPYRTAARLGQCLRADIVVRTSNGELALWFDKALATGIRPDIVARKGCFQHMEQYSEGHVCLMKDGELFAEYRLDQPPTDEGYVVESTPKLSGSYTPIFFRAKSDFFKPPLIVECKSFGARLGNPDKYAAYAEKVILVSPEPLYQPRAENMVLVRVSSDFDNIKLQTSLREFLDL